MCPKDAIPEKNSYWRLLFREGNTPAGTIGQVIDPCNEADEVVLDLPEGEMSFKLEAFYERCQQPAREPSIMELADAHELLGCEAVELAHDIWCRDNQMPRPHAAQGSTRAMLLVAYPELRKKIISELNPVIEAGAPRTSSYKPEEDADWEQFVCEECGSVEKLPWRGGKVKANKQAKEERPENMPWCAHGNSYQWLYGDKSRVKQAEENGWVQMKRAEVRVREEDNEA